jgi:hypothetical protein
MSYSAYNASYVKNNTPISQYWEKNTLDYRRKTNSNTWGFSRKIGDHTFGDYHYAKITYKGHMETERTKIDCIWKAKDEEKAEKRNLLRKYTRVLDIAGYIPGIALIAGLIRVIAAKIMGQQIETQISDEVLTGDLAEEARRTYQSQISRGWAEMLPLIGSIINLSYDIAWYRAWGEKPVGNLI